MGDMKTPDFDDLLAAFDIPDIDAKEAIQSSPEKEEHEVVANVDEKVSGSPPCFPCPLASHIDPPVVSVIVKNTVRSESFQEEKSFVDETDNPSSSGSNCHVQVSFGDITSQLGPKMPVIDPVRPQVSNGFEEPSNQEQSSSQPWPHHSPLRSTLKAKEGDSPEVAVGTVQPTSDVLVNLKPLLYPQSSSSASPNASISLYPDSVSPNRSPHNPQKEETCLTNPSTPLPQNGSIKAGIRHVIPSDEDDSEPDLGSPLVIQESPESAMSSPPKFKCRAKVQYPELLGSLETTACLVSHPPLLSSKPEALCEEKEQPTTPIPTSTAPQPQSLQDCLPSISTDTLSVQTHEKEKYPEHVIEERDSPESPPPSETGQVVPKRSSSPDQVQTSGLSANKVLCYQEELTGTEVRDDRPCDSVEPSENIAVDGKNVKEENCEAGPEDPVSVRAAEKVSPPLHPLKVKIKMYSGSVTKTVSCIAAKRGGRAATKGVDSSKPSPERNTRSKRELSQESQMPTMVQEGTCSIKDKSTVETNLHVSSRAVNITKTAALSSVSGSLKSLNSGMALPAPSPLLHPQGSSRPASIVNSTGAIISRSQTNLVEAFNKILNNRNLLPSYKPDLSSPLPAEWGLPLPAQVNSCCVYF